MKITSHKTFILTSITALMITLSISSHAKIYKWVDNKGQTHYTATPPPADQANSDAENIEKDIKANIGKYQAKTEVDESDEKNKKPETKDTPLAGPPASLIKYCDTQRKNLKTLQENYRSSWSDERGNVTRLSQEQRQEKAEFLKEKIEKDCSDIPASKPTEGNS